MLVFGENAETCPIGFPFKGLAVDDALRKAQAHVRSRERWKHPYYWAAWVLWGLPD